MFRSDRDALAEEVEYLRREKARLDAENAAMRSDLLAQRREALPIPGGSVYKRSVESLTAGERAALARHELKSFPVWGALLAHFATFGLFSLIHFGLLHDRLPQAERDDPSAGKAIGFSFLPYFNLYWVVFNTLRLTDRVNLQYRLRGLPGGVPRGLMLASAVVGVIPYVNLLFGIFIFWPIAIVYLQRAVNRLAALSEDDAARAKAGTAADAWTPEVGWKSANAPWSAHVASVPGPRIAEDARAEEEVEALAEAEGAQAEVAGRRR